MAQSFLYFHGFYALALLLLLPLETVSARGEAVQLVGGEDLHQAGEGSVARQRHLVADENQLPLGSGQGHVESTVVSQDSRWLVEESARC